MKKRKKKLLIAAFVVLVLVGIGYVYLFCGGRVTDAANEVTAGEEGTDSLVVYFTRSDVIKTDGVDAVSSASLNQTDSGLIGNTEIPARIIQELTGADLYAIKTERYYRSPFMGTAATAWIEENFDMRPALAAKPDDLDKYDVIYVGFPIWWFNAPMAIGTFLESYDLEGKIVVPFCTSQDNGIDVSMDYIRDVSGKAAVLNGMRIHGSGPDEVKQWLTDIFENVEAPALIPVTEAAAESMPVRLTENDVDSETEITEGTQNQRGFINNNIFHSETGDIHYSSYIPESYDGQKPYALFITLPGWEGLYFQGIGANMMEDYGIEAQKYNSEMIILSPQLDDWGENSAEMTIALTEYFLEHYNIDPEKVYLEGLSGGGETGSIVMEKKPELYTAYLGVSSQWVGELDRLAKVKTPVYLAIGEDDSYYGSKSFKETYAELYRIYENQEMTQEEIDHILILDVKEQPYFTKRGVQDQHAGGFTFAHEETIMGWLFGEHEKAVSSRH